MKKKKIKNPLIRRIPRELLGDWKKYIVVALFLIRTIGFRREAGVWQFRTLAGAGIVADSDPAQELAETEAKIAAIRAALTV